MNSILKHSKVYLSGPIENLKDSGVSWRQNFKNLTEHLNIKIFDPTDKPKSLRIGDGINEETSVINNFRTKEDWNGLIKHVKKIRRIDLRLCDLSDFIVVYIDRNIPSVGTWDEVFTAEDQQKPIFAIVNGGVRNLPGWLFGVLNINEVFSTIEDCVEYLNDINDGKIDLDNRWVLIKE